jgi:hypothetical protein
MLRNGLLRQGLAGSGKAVKVCCVRAWRGKARKFGQGLLRRGVVCLVKAVEVRHGEVRRGQAGCDQARRSRCGKKRKVLVRQGGHWI